MGSCVSLPQGWGSAAGRWASESGDGVSVSCLSQAVKKHRCENKKQNTGVMLNFQDRFLQRQAWIRVTPAGEGRHLQWLAPESSRLLCLWNSLGKTAGVGSHSLLQGIYPGLLHDREILYHLSH